MAFGKLRDTCRMSENAGRQRHDHVADEPERLETSCVGESWKLWKKMCLAYEVGRCSMICSQEGALVLELLPVTSDQDHLQVSGNWVIIRWITISYVKTKRRGYKYRSSEET